MSKNTAVPDAWDDDWDKAVDKPSATAEPAEPQVKLSRAERKQQHQELNKQIWEAAEQPERAYFLEAKGDAPLKTDFKPQVTVLSRKPTPQLAKNMNSLTLDDDQDSEEEERKKNEATFAERQRKAAEERREKERKYAEVRQRLFGSADSSREPSSSRGPSTRGDKTSRRGRGRGTRDSTPRDSQPTSSADQSPARSTNYHKQLFDPTYAQKPRNNQSPRPTISNEEQPIRMPRGPDTSGRGGFGFAPRGGRPGA